MSDVFFTSDQHFGHRFIIEACKRPFASVEEQTEVLIERHNKKVKAGDRVYHLGDFAFKATVEEAYMILRRLNGQHFLIRGNHDETQDEMQRRAILRFLKGQEPFIWIRDLDYLKVGDQAIMLCHYPMRSWKKMESGAWHLFGHCHGRLPRYGNSFDIGVDSWNFEPVSFEEVAQRMAKAEL